MFSPPLEFPHLQLDLGDTLCHPKPSSPTAAPGTGANAGPTGEPVPAVTIPATNPGQPNNRKNRRNTSSHAARKKQRERENEANAGLTAARPEVCDKHVTASQPLHIQVDARNLRATASGYTAVKLNFADTEPVTKLEDVVGEKSTRKLRLIKWDGM